MWVLHSNVSLRYLLGASMYFNCFWCLWSTKEDSDGFQRAQNEHICRFWGFFRPTLMLPIHQVHSNVSLRYLPGTDIYYYCCRVLWVTNGVCKGPSKGPKLSIFLFVQLFGLFHAHIEVFHLSNELKCFPEQPIRYWHIFQLFLAPVRYIQAL